MIDGADSDFLRATWLEVFLAYVVKEAPSAPQPLLLSAAERLYARLGQFNPIDVAEAEWNELPLADQTVRTTR